MTPTNDPRIYETQWIGSASALIEVKYYYAKVDNLVFYIRAVRGVAFDAIKSTDDVEQMVLDTDKVYEDNSQEQFKRLQKFLDSPVK